MASNKKYWKSEAELLPNDPIVETLKQNEFVEHLPVDQFMGDKNTLSETSTNRRDFLKFVGFSTAAASLAACEGPVIKTIPYVIQPEEIVPGVANYYATTIANGFDFASILVKTREGRPIKVENNKEAAVKGVANARVQASVLSLYDASRLQGPLKGSEPISWDDLDIAMITHLEATKGGSKAVVLMTPTYASPSAEKLIQELQDKYPQVKRSNSIRRLSTGAHVGTCARACLRFTQLYIRRRVFSAILGDAGARRGECQLTAVA